MRSAVIIVCEEQVALIQRQRSSTVYFLFPGGKVEPGEMEEAAAIREAMEELGVRVELQGLVAKRISEPQQVFFSATITGGEFGSGTGEELSSGIESDRGSYTPVWLPLDRLADVDVRPKSLALRIMQDALLDEPIEVQD
jgi:8-oxo-dGTP pyrophosphatase MutT (NUDIX family)